MPSFTPDPAPLVERAQNVIDGDIEMLGGTRFARIKGLTASLLSAMPPGTFFANLYDTAEPGRPFDAATIAGDGLTYDLHITNGPFPEVVAEAEQAFPTSVTVVSVTLPIAPVAKDRVIIATQHNGVNTVTTPSGYTLLSHVALADSDVNVYERILTGTEAASVSITASVAGAVLSKVWVIRYANETTASEVVNQSNTGTGGTSNDLGTLTPSWGIANDLWLTFIGIENDVTAPNITAFPTSFVSTGELQNVSATASLDGAIGWGQLASRLTSLDPTAYTYGPARSAAFIIAVPPRESGRFNVTPGGGAGWDDVLLVDAHSGASNPIIDNAQFLQFNTAAPPATGQIRSGANILINGSLDVNIESGADTHIHPNGDLHLGHTATTGQIHMESGTTTEILAGTDFDLSAGGSVGVIATTDISLSAPNVLLSGGFLTFVEQAASTPSMSAGIGMFWVKNDVPNNPMFTDDTNSDRQIATYPLILGGFPSIAPKSVIANASNVTAVPTALAASLAFQHLRVNSGNTGLEWSVLTTGDFPNNSVPVTALAQIATDTLLANITAGTATPVAVPFTSIDSTSIVWDAATHTFQLAAASAGDITRAQNSVTYTINNNAITNAKLATMAALTVKANATNAVAVPTDVAAAADDTVFRRTASTLNWGGLTLNMAANDLWTYAKIQNVSATSRFLGRITAGAGDIEELTGTQATSLLDNFTSTLKGLAPLSGGGTTNFLRADGTWAAPPGTGAGTGLQFVTYGSEATLSNERVTTASTSITINTGVASQIAFERAALTGEVTAGANANATTITRSTAFGDAAPWTGDHRFDANLRLNGTFEVRGRNDVTLAADANNLDMSTFNVLRIAGNNFKLTGMIPLSPGNGHVVLIINSDAIDDLTITHQDAASTAANQFFCPDNQNYRLPARASVWAYYDDTANFWFLISDPVPQSALGVPTPSPGIEYQTWVDERFDYLVVSSLGATTSMQDVFVGITNGSKSHWGFFANAARGSVAASAGQAGHFGIVEGTTGTTANDFVAIGAFANRTNSNSGIISMSNVLSLDWWCQPSGTLTNLEIIIGLGNDVNAAFIGTASAIFIFNPTTNANWQCITRLASTNTTTTTGTAGNSTAWKRFTIWRNPDATQIRFYINNALVATHTANLPTGNMIPAVSIQTLNTTAKTLRVDHCKILANTATMVA